MSSPAVNPDGSSHSERLAAVAAIVNDHASWASRSSSSITALLSALASLEACEPPFALVDGDVPFSTRASRLLAWCGSHPGYSSSPVEIVEGGLQGLPADARGMRASAPIKAGALAVSVPIDLAISTDSAYVSSELGPLLDSNGIEILAGMPPIILALHVLVEHSKALSVELSRDVDIATYVPTPASAFCGRTLEQVQIDQSEAAKLPHGVSVSTALCTDAHPWGSRFRAFLACLPSRVPNCLFWSKETFARLGSSRCAVLAAKFLRDAAKTYVVLHQLFVASDVIHGFAPFWTWASFRWALANVMSRQNQLPSLPDAPKPVRVSPAQRDTTLALLPVFDMINHKSGVSMPQFEPGPPRVSTFVDLDVAAGEEITMSYGARSGGESLMFQGFLTAESVKSDPLVLKVYLPSTFNATDDPLWSLKTSILEKLGISWRFQGSAHFAELAKARGAHVQIAMQQFKASDKWSVPLDFALREDGDISQLLSLSRVLFLSRAEMPSTLKASQAAHEAMVAHMKLREEEEAAHGHSHGDRGCEGGHNPVRPRIPGLPFVSPDNEQKARAFLDSLFLSAAMPPSVEPENEGGARAEDPYVTSYIRHQEALLGKAVSALALPPFPVAATSDLD